LIGRTNPEESSVRHASFCAWTKIAKKFGLKKKEKKYMCPKVLGLHF
jgi:hypothetical protein